MNDNDNMSITTLLEPDNEGHRHSLLVGKKCMYCMDCGKIVLEYKKKDDFYKWLHAFEAFAKGEDFNEQQ